MQEIKKGDSGYFLEINICLTRAVPSTNPCLTVANVSHTYWFVEHKHWWPRGLLSLLVKVLRRNIPQDKRRNISVLKAWKSDRAVSKSQDIIKAFMANHFTFLCGRLAPLHWLHVLLKFDISSLPVPRRHYTTSAWHTANSILQIANSMNHRINGFDAFTGAYQPTPCLFGLPAWQKLARRILAAK